MQTSTPPTPPLNPVRSASEFFRGVGDVWRGFAFLLVHPSLWVSALIPFTLNILLLGGLAWLGWHLAAPWIEQWFFADHGFWMNLLGWLVDILLWVAIALVVTFTFVPLASLIAAPFNDFLSEKVEILYHGRTVDESFSVRALVRGIAVSLRNCFKLTLLTLLMLGFALTLHLIPGIGSLLFALVSTAITIRFIVLEYTSYSMDRRYYTFERQRAFLRCHRARTVGLGAMAFVMVMIPVVNALFIPVSAVAGTLLFCDTELRSR